MNLKILLASLLIIFGNIAFAQDFSYEETNFQELEHFFESETYSIIKIDPEKVYLNENRIHVSRDGIFLLLDDEENFIKLSSLFSDDNGCFILNYQEKLGHRIQIYNNCRRCG
jgi:hypothetical protein